MLSKKLDKLLITSITKRYVEGDGCHSTSTSGHGWMSGEDIQRTRLGEWGHHWKEWSAEIRCAHFGCGYACFIVHWCLLILSCAYRPVFGFSPKALVVMLLRLISFPSRKVPFIWLFKQVYLLFLLSSPIIILFMIPRLSASMLALSRSKVTDLHVLISDSLLNVMCYSTSTCTNIRYQGGFRIHRQVKHGYSLWYARHS